jgi:hypothetical protein
VKYNYAQYLANNIHFQLSEFEASRYFRYQSYLVHLFLYSQATRFQHLEMKIEDEMGNPCSIIHWTPLIRRKSQNTGLSEFINQFMSLAFEIIHDETPPRIFPECKKVVTIES